MSQTLSVFQSGVGGFVGDGAMHPDVADAAREVLTQAVQSSLLLDAVVAHCGAELSLIVSHDRGERSQEIDRLAWDAFTAGAQAAARLHLHGAGRGLIADTFPGSIVGAGPAVAESTLVERVSEPVVVFLGERAAAGSFNLPLFKMFADPFNTAGLVISESLQQGCMFEVHDTLTGRKIMLNSPDEMYDLLLLLGSPSRYAVKRVITRAGGEIAAVASTERAAQGAGHDAGGDSPTTIVRCEGAFPTVAEVLEPFTAASIVAGASRGSHHGPWMPVAMGEPGAATDRAAGGPPRVVALGFQLAAGKLIGPRDLFDDVTFDAARAEATRVAAYLRRHGPFEPHRLPLDEVEYPPTVAAKLEGRWSAM